MFITFLIALTSFIIGWKIAKVKYRQFYASQMALLLNELGVSKAEVNSARAQMSQRAAVNALERNPDVTSDQLADTLSLFTVITIEQSGNNVVAYNDNTFVAQAKTVAELHSLVKEKYDSSIAFVTEDTAISEALAEVNDDLPLEVTVRE